MSINRVPEGTKVKIAKEFHQRKFSDETITPDTILTVSSVWDYAGEHYPTFTFEGRKIELNGLFLELADSN